MIDGYGTIRVMATLKTLRLCLSIAVAIIHVSCGGDAPSTPTGATPSTLDVAGTWIGEYRQIRCEVNGAPCEGKPDQGWIRLQLPRHMPPPAAMSGTFETGGCSLAGDLQFDVSRMVNGRVDADRLSLHGEQFIRRGFVEVTTLHDFEIVVIATMEMHGRYTRRIRSTSAPSDELVTTTSITVEYELARLARVAGQLPRCGPLPG